MLSLLIMAHHITMKLCLYANGNTLDSFPWPDKFSFDACKKGLRIPEVLAYAQGRHVLAVIKQRSKRLLSPR